jgi:hypothetical protein
MKFSRDHALMVGAHEHNLARKHHRKTPFFWLFLQVWVSTDKKSSGKVANVALRRPKGWLPRKAGHEKRLGNGRITGNSDKGSEVHHA